MQTVFRPCSQLAHGTSTDAGDCTVSSKERTVEGEDIAADSQEKKTHEKMEEELPKHEEKAVDRVAALLDAAKRGCVDDIQRLLNEGVDASSKGADGNSALHLAAREGHLEAVNALIDADSPLFDDAQSSSPLHLAAASGHLEVVSALVAAGARLDAKDERHETPLFYAVTNGHSDCVEFLAAEGADFQGETWHGMTPLHQAVSTDNEQCVRALLRAGADVNAQSRFKFRPLHWVQSARMVIVLAQAGVHLNFRGIGGNTPLHWAAGFGRAECVEQLLNIGANPFIRNDEGKRPVDVAVDDRSREILRDAMY